MNLLVNLSLPELLAFQWMNNLIRYFLIAGTTYMVFWKWGFARFRPRFLYATKPARAEQLREIKYSILSMFVFLLPAIIRMTFKDLGLFQVYLDIHEKSLGWYVASYFVVFIIHDTYFYWTHRFMHHPKVFKYVHRTHHLSIQPSPMAAFSFHPLEAFIEGSVFLVITLFIPIHFSVLFFFTLFSLFMNVYGHLGFNLFNPEKLKKFPYHFFNHSTHHSWHHRYQRGNYGFYLQFWDKIMGTWKGELPEVKTKEQTSEVRP